MFTRLPNVAVLLVIGVALSTASPGAGEIPPYGPALDPHGGGIVCSLKLDCIKPHLGSQYGPEMAPIGYGPEVDPIGYGPETVPMGYGPDLDTHGYGAAVDPHGLPFSNR